MKSAALWAIVIGATVMFANGCGQRGPKPSPPITLVILDCTDPLRPEQMDALEVWVRNRVTTQMSENELVSLWVLGGSGGMLQRTFQARVPRLASNPLFSNPSRLRARANAQFIDPLLQNLRAANAAGSASLSPIWQSIAQLRELGEIEGDATHLVLISDLRQHDLPTQAGQRPARARLDHVDVSVVFVPRPRFTLDEEVRLERQWRSDLTSSGARSVYVDRL